MTDTAAEPHERHPDLRCSPWTRAQGVDPIGSAGRFDQLLLVECPLPWPADVAQIPALTVAAGHGTARVMAVVPLADEPHDDGLARVVHHRRVGTHELAGVDHRVEPGAVPELLASLLAEPAGDDLGRPSAVGVAPPQVLVCGHGRRDACCGRWGTLLHIELAAGADRARVWRCSHTGGHRFAPTAITLPEGRAWAYADAELIGDVVSRGGNVRALLEHDRGNVAFEPWAQVVEREVFARLGWDWLTHEVTAARTEPAADGGSARVALRWRAPDGAPGSAEAQVVVARTLPVLTCGEPPEVAAKQSPEYRLGHFEMSAR